MTWVAVGVAVVGTVYGGVQAKKAGQASAAESRLSGFAAQKEAAMDDAFRGIEADDIDAAARDEADSIKQSAMLVRGSMAVAQSHSGAVIGEGSAQAAFDQLDTLSSADALAALYSGVNRAASARTAGRLGIEAGVQRASAFERQAVSQTKAGDAALTGSLLSAGATFAGGYAKSRTPVTPPPSKG